ncbi:epidermal growth factor receptor kinase substrate 8-like protein 3 isoform X1 [Alligator mississippiensis]|uniref:epidermal growth factor receptor kinase substrate 8-like protein 3 isoform X1 n=1 Tax=Alligator mississippiensis TaxID=8496 RepID=UPI000711A2CB|nr:epidermal growth factor receptor kinase substrate 8-like protein 3 isoform X1 [Alligator mississippiensis]
MTTDLFGRRTEPPLSNKLGRGSPDLNRSNSMSRPSSKAIYHQRKDYALTVLKQQWDLRHHVEHLLTLHVDSKNIRDVDDCIMRLKMLEAQGRVWGQDMILEVKDHELLLSDIESKEELESFPLESILRCTAVLDSCTYDSVLAITMQDRNRQGISILLFQCTQSGAELMKTNLEKAVKEWKSELESQHMLRNSLETMLSQQRPIHGIQDSFGPPQPAPALDQHYYPKQRDQPEWMDDRRQKSQDLDRDSEILNHVLNDIELFVGKVKEASGSLNTKKKMAKKKGKQKGVLLPELEYQACFRKIKYACNLLGKLKPILQEPNAPELLQLLFSILSFTISSCPWSDMASSTISPLLTKEAIDLLEENLEGDDHATWKMLGTAWTLTRAEYPNGQSVPTYLPTFSDEWVPPLPARESPTPMAQQPEDSEGYYSIRPELMQAMYEFQARNHKELSVRKGDMLEVLDQRKKWWLVQNSTGERGYIPSNILAPADQEPSVENGMNQGPRQPPSLRLNSTAAEVTEWLKDKGFSRITVKSLGVLTGRQLLEMSQGELKAICPEDWRRVVFKLSAVKTSLGTAAVNNACFEGLKDLTSQD